MKVYHRTSNEAAILIYKEGRFVSKEDGDVFVSNRQRGQTDGYGESVVALDIPSHLLRLDDEFPGGERHYRVAADVIQPDGIL